MHKTSALLDYLYIFSPLGLKFPPGDMLDKRVFKEMIQYFQDNRIMINGSKNEWCILIRWEMYCIFCWAHGAHQHGNSKRHKIHHRGAGLSPCPSKNLVIWWPNVIIIPCVLSFNLLKKVVDKIIIRMSAVQKWLYLTEWIHAGEMLVWPRGRCGLFSAAILARGHLDAPIRVAITLSASWNAKFFAQKPTALSPAACWALSRGRRGQVLRPRPPWASPR